MTTLLLSASASTDVLRFEMGDIVHELNNTLAPILLSVVWRTIFASTDSEPFDYDGFLQTHLDTLLRGLAKP